jgi:Glycosyltransferase family 87
VRFSAALTAAAIVVFLGSWSLLHHGFFTTSLLNGDTGLYAQYGDEIAHGEVPYRDFQPEYPPGALAIFVLPSLGHEGDTDAYNRWFDRLMALCGCVAIVGAALVLRALDAGRFRTAISLGLIAISPVLVGPVVLSRFDLWPAALAVLALVALVWERLALAALGLGAAIAAKLWPAVIAPLAIAWVWKRRGRNAALRWTAGLVAVEAAIFLPFSILSPGGMRHSLDSQLARPLQLESLGGAILIAIHRLFDTHLTVYTTMSQNLAGTGAGWVEDLTTGAQLTGLVAAWALFAMGPATRERLVGYTAAAAAFFIAFAKVFSPQFAIWLIPLVPLVRRRSAAAALVVALGLTGLYFPRHYWRLAALHSPQSWELLARDLAVLAIGLLLVVREPRTERVEELRLLSPAEST